MSASHENSRSISVMKLVTGGRIVVAYHVEQGRLTESVHLEIYGYRSWNHIRFLLRRQETEGYRAMAGYGKPMVSGIPLDPVGDSLRVTAQDPNMVTFRPLLRDTQWEDYKPRLPERHSPADPFGRGRCLHRPDHDHRLMIRPRAVNTECTVAYKRIRSTHRMEWSAESGNRQMEYKIDWGKAVFIRRCPRFMKRVRNLVVEIC
ncbi:hypothetical protein DL764_002768 [Monosporascus ibericus]|uniref:Uncharacterized protein n=1 Tax=Monosporascus ibericus TaxID=155417 RepID=A0A4Q4TJ71_9PEZI|nr:hypothetical protein DL764_002768 [Monosporascus ibericus]